MRRATAVASFLLLLLPRMAATSAAPVTDPFTGTWKLNLERSQLPAPVPQSQITHLIMDGNKISVRQEITYASGRTNVVTVEAKLDGQDYPVTGSPLADTMAFHRSGKRSIRAIAKLGGSVIESEGLTVSDDDQTMTTIYTWHDADGKEVTATAVFDRQGSS
jgi:hypothetical protein